ncbi:MAG: signal peptidase I [Anaerolinea sp.]|nr:signal peptidase I [Anaerolinea sp.]
MIYFPHDNDHQTRRERLIAAVLPVIREWTKALAVVTLFALIMNLFFPRYAVEGRSMEPTLHETDRLFVSNLDIMTRLPQRGEVVILTSPHDGDTVVKRVIGLPGETVEVRGGVVYIDGAALDEPYINEPPRYTGRWVIGEHQYFILGDNRNHSLDSSDYGPIDESIIHGVVKFRWFPFDSLYNFPLPQYR